MARAALAAALVVVLGGCLAARAGAATPHPTAGAARPHRAAGAYEPHEVLVGYRPGPVSAFTSAVQMRMGVRRVAGGSPAPGARLLRLPAHESVIAALRRLRRLPGIAYAEPDFIARSAGAFYPNDPGKAGQPRGWEQMQWNLLPIEGVNAPEAWSNLIADHRPGGRGVTVAILDSGVAYRNYKHFRRSPDLAGTRFVHPYDFVAHNAYPLDREGHGTFVADMVAESTNNGIGLVGLAYGASIMPVRVLDASGLGDEATIAEAIRYAARNGAQVINLSLEFLPNEVSSARDIPAIVSAINFAHSRGVTVVGAAGNDQSSQVAYPARAPNVISVGATTRDDCLADYSNGGVGLDLVAPGGGSDAVLPDEPLCHPERSLSPIWQLTLDDPPHWSRFGYPDYYIGTSMSAPEVAAAAAMVIASGVIGRHPAPAQILDRLEQTATPLGGATPNANYGYGLLNVGAATAPLTPAG